MFRQFVADPSTSIGTGIRVDPARAATLSQLHPLQLSALLELAWDTRIYVAGSRLGGPDRRSDKPGLASPFVQGGPALTAAVGTTSFIGRPPSTTRWHHLIYAYLIENTRVLDVFRRVLSEYRHGEKLGATLPPAEFWLRITEELFFRYASPFTINSITSDIRPDAGATRRNAYHRMFGSELAHGAPNGGPYPYIKAETANSSFVETLEELLREVWVGISNQGNTSGTNATDDAGLLELVRQLEAMLLTRRQNGLLAREEFWAVATLSWFHLAVDYNSPIVASLRCEGGNETERLEKIAERVGLEPHKKSFHLFGLAEALSRFLTLVETGIFTAGGSGSVRALYSPPGSPLEETMRLIVTYWSEATGKNLKKKVQPVVAGG